ncbi:hypothetical protein KUCAC02_001842 [Chaenocephalus aceratus]|uniref:Uncharacterized protein n=1 Tax=Chaenocephalus aceratus TaxID=36190 RepID=A0ACB9XSY7_CHAAC|nr:hypothetical protein KUCAC02_001842 [Chaenocephalus aceratus]
MRTEVTPPPLAPMKATVGKKHPQQGLVLPQPGFTPLRVLLLGLKAAALHLVTLVGPASVRSMVSSGMSTDAVRLSPALHI